MNLGVKHLIRFKFYLKIGSLKKFVRGIKGLKCLDCRFDKEPKIYDFVHI